MNINPRSRAVNIKNPIIQIIILAIIVFFGYGFFDIFLSKYLNERNIANALKKYADEGNSYCPIKVGGRDDLIVEKIYYKNKKTVVSEYRIMNYSRNDFDSEAMKNNFIESHINELDSIENLTVLRNNNVIFEYHYFDKEREEVFKIILLFNTPIKAIN